MLRAISALALFVALVVPGHAVAQSPPVAAPLGTLDGFQGFLTEHGFTLQLEPLDATTTSWGAFGSSDDLKAYALGQADSLLQVNLMVVLSDDDPLERAADLAAIRAFVDVYAPEALPSVAALDLSGPLDTHIELDDRLVGILHDTSELDIVVAAVRLRAAGDAAPPILPLASATPSPAVRSEMTPGYGDD